MIDPKISKARNIFWENTARNIAELIIIVYKYGTCSFLLWSIDETLGPVCLNSPASEGRAAACKNENYRVDLWFF